MLYNGGIAPPRSGGGSMMTEGGSNVRVLLLVTEVRGNANTISHHGYWFRGRLNSAGCLLNARRKPSKVLAWPGVPGAA